tara:strand:- start:246 stop:443 length:198 start_codon:yes stop_codon:yes gene_type:complete
MKTLEKEISDIIKHGMGVDCCIETISQNILYIMQRDWGADTGKLKYKGRPWEREDEKTTHTNNFV